MNSAHASAAARNPTASYCHTPPRPRAPQTAPGAARPPTAPATGPARPRCRVPLALLGAAVGGPNLECCGSLLRLLEFVVFLVCACLVMAMVATDGGASLASLSSSPNAATSAADMATGGSPAWRSSGRGRTAGADAFRSSDRRIPKGPDPIHNPKRSRGIPNTVSARMVRRARRRTRPPVDEHRQQVAEHEESPAERVAEPDPAAVARREGGELAHPPSSPRAKGRRHRRARAPARSTSSPHAPMAVAPPPVAAAVLARSSALSRMPAWRQ